MIFDVRHRTTFRYTSAVDLSHQLLHLQPRSTEAQTVMQSELTVSPEAAVRRDGHDYHGNHITHLTVQAPHTELMIEHRAKVDVNPPPPYHLSLSESWEKVADRLSCPSTADALDASQYILDSPHAVWTSDVRAFVDDVAVPGRPVLDLAMALTRRIFEDFTYKGGVTEISTPPDEILKHKSGVCQDFAHLSLAAFRSLGLAARYVSGYLLTRPPEGQEKRIGADASHAWISVWSPDLGWIDFDPTNGLIPSNEHITVGWGRDYACVSPINGFIVGGGSQTVQVAVDVAAA